MGAAGCVPRTWRRSVRDRDLRGVRARNAAADLRVSITRTERVYAQNLFAGMCLGVAAKATTEGDVMRGFLWFLAGFATGVVIASLALMWVMAMEIGV